MQLTAVKGFIGIVRKLLGVGTVVDTPGSPFFGRTAIEGAAEWDRTDTLYLLLKGASPPLVQTEDSISELLSWLTRKVMFPS